MTGLVIIANFIIDEKPQWAPLNSWFKYLAGSQTKNTVPNLTTISATIFGKFLGYVLTLAGKCSYFTHVWLILEVIETQYISDIRLASHELRWLETSQTITMHFMRTLNSLTTGKVPIHYFLCGKPSTNFLAVACVLKSSLCYGCFCVGNFKVKKHVSEACNY